MKHVEEMIKYNTLLEAGNVQGILDLFSTHPTLFNDQQTHACVVEYCILGSDRANILHVLLRIGASADIASPNDPNGRPIYTAANVRHWGCFKCLIEHGAEVNFEVPGRVPYCVPLPSVIRAGNLDMVKLLVEAGGMVNGIDRRGQTPLDWAVGCNGADIADYLRSVGAVRGADLEPPATVPVAPPPDTKPKSKKRK